ncbi:hypothetical protein AB205_0060990, partial [Aquarana catesbeiana]
QETHRSYKQKLEELTKLQTLCSSSITRQKKKLKDLSLELKKVKGSQENEDAQIKDIQENIKLRERTFSEMESFLPKKNGVGDAVFNFLLVWYYCTLTIRESILINNGSRLVGPKPLYIHLPLRCHVNLARWINVPDFQKPIPFIFYVSK